MSTDTEFQNANLPELRRSAGVVNMEDYAMSTQNVLAQVQLIQHVMRSVMKDGEHYGVIPGTKKPSLYKPGAEKLSMTFRLAPSYPIVERIELPNGHREYIVRCVLTHIPSGNVVGEGMGSCSSMENKYRYRTGEVTFTGKPVPKGYWKDRDLKLIGGRGFSTKKNPDSGQWEIVEAGEKVENDNPADGFNTILKMAKKRAHVDAVLTVTAASDIFTQDLEDTSPPVPNGAQERSPDENLRSSDLDKARLSVEAAAKNAGISIPSLRDYLRENLSVKFEDATIDDLRQLRQAVKDNLVAEWEHRRMDRAAAEAEARDAEEVPPPESDSFPEDDRGTGDDQLPLGF